MSEVKWVTKKPKLNKPCLLLAASKISRVWEYSVFKIDKVDGFYGWYWGIMDGNGEEWGAIEDFKADKYCILELLK